MVGTKNYTIILKQKDLLFNNIKGNAMGGERKVMAGGRLEIRHCTVAEEAEYLSGSGNKSVEMKSLKTLNLG